MGVLEKLIDAAKRGAVDEARALIQDHPEVINQADETGATALHYAAFEGHQDAVRLLVEHGADINARDGRFRATPAGWAIEYMREMGGLLGIELHDFAYAIRTGDVAWTSRFLHRFPGLAQACDSDGTPFRVLAERLGHAEIVRLFESNAKAKS